MARERIYRGRGGEFQIDDVIVVERESGELYWYAIKCGIHPDIEGSWDGCSAQYVREELGESTSRSRDRAYRRIDELELLIVAGSSLDMLSPRICYSFWPNGGTLSDDQIESYLKAIFPDFPTHD